MAITCMKGTQTSRSGYWNVCSGVPSLPLALRLAATEAASSHAGEAKSGLKCAPFFRRGTAAALPRLSLTGTSASLGLAMGARLSRGKVACVSLLFETALELQDSQALR